jgi:hypothetical protein
MNINDQLHTLATLFPGHGPRRPLKPQGRSENFPENNNFLSLFEIKTHYFAARSKFLTHLCTN